MPGFYRLTDAERTELGGQEPQGEAYQPRDQQGEQGYTSAFGDYQGYVPYTPGTVRTVYEHRYSYWERPENIAAHYDAIQAEPDADWASMGVDVDFVNNAYDTLKNANNGASWWDWKPLDLGDPIAEQLRAAAEPAPGMQWHGVYKPDYLLPQDQQQAQVPTGGDLANLTGWQRTMAFLQSNGTMQGITNMLPWAAIGAASGFAVGGPVGGIVGGLGAMIAGGVMGWAGDPETQAAARQKMLAAGYAPETIDFLFNTGNAALRTLNLPAEWMEQGIGTAAQLGEAWLPSLPYRLLGYQDMFDEYTQSQADVRYLLDNLPDVWEASRLTYEAAATTQLGGMITHVPAGIEWLADMATSGQTDVNFAGIGQVYTLTSPEPTQLDMMGAAILAAARNEVKSGANPMTVIEKYQRMTGFSGQFADLMYQSFADPLNVVPMAERGVVRVGAKLTGNPVLEMAARNAAGEGLVGTYRNYGELLRQGVEGTPAPAQFTKFQRWVADVTPEGIFKELQPGTAGTGTRVKRGFLGFAESPLNPVTWWKSISELTPKSKLSMFTGIAQGNMGELIRYYDGDVEATVRDLAALSELGPQELRVMGSRLGNPEMYTVRQGLAGYNEKLQGRISRWRAGENTRQVLLRIAQATGEDYHQVVKQLREGGVKEAQNLYQRTVNKIRETAPDSPLLRDPAFNAGSLKQSAAMLKETPWVSDPGFFQADLYRDVTNHLEKWAIEAFGVKPEAGIFRANAAMKAAQSLLLLDFNPAYLVNNVVNNAVTLAAEGVGGFVGPTNVRSYLDWVGGLGAKASEGIGMAGETGKPIKTLYTSFEQAYQEGGMDAAMAWATADVTNLGAQASKAGDAIEKLKNKIPAGPMRAISGKFESSQSVIAHYNGTMQAWSRMWNRKGTIPKMPADLRANLERIDPRLPDLIIAGIEASKSKGDLNKLLSGLDQLQRRADPYVESVARVTGMDSAMMREMLTQTNVLEKINTALDAGATIDDAVNSVARDVQAMVREGQAARLANAAVQGAAQMRGEGFGAAVNSMRDVFWAHDEFWTRQFAESERAFESGNQMLGPDRRKHMEQFFKTQREEWSQHNREVEANWYGMLKEAGFTDPTVREQLSLNSKKFMGDLVGQHKKWGQFYIERERRVKKFFKDSGNASPEQSARLWADTQAEIGIMYDNYTRAELDSVKRMGATFLDMYQEQFGTGGIEGVAYWWRGIYQTSERRIALMKDMRAWERGEGAQLPEMQAALKNFTPENRHAAWPKMLEKVYLPAIGEMTQSHLDGVKAFSDGATGRPLPPEMAEALQWWKDNGVQLDQVQDAQAAVQAVEETVNVRLMEEAQPLQEEPEPAAEAAPIETGQPVNTREANFKRWFGDSKVVDENGAPLVVYHGTTADFTEFKKYQHFGTSEAAADRLSTVAGETDRQVVYPVYLRIENPYPARDVGLFTPIELALETLGDQQAVDIYKRWVDGLNDDAKAKVLESLGLDTTDEIPEYYKSIDEELVTLALGGDKRTPEISSNSETLMDEVIEYLKADGYDGIVYRNDVEDTGNNSYVIFDPKQIKSVFNTGEFNPESANILDFNNGAPVPIDQVPTTEAVNPRTLDDVYIPALKAEGWTRGKKGLLGAVNADRAEQGLEPYKKAADVPFDDAMAAMRKRVPAEAEPPPPADLPEPKADQPKLPPVSVQRYLEPHTLMGMPIIGAAYVGGKFAAYIPFRFETNKVFTTAEGPARLLGINPDGQWVYRMESGELKTLADGDQNIPVTGPFLPGTMESHGAVQPDQAAMYREGFGMWTRPVLDELAKQMKQGAPLGGDLARLDENGVNQLRQYIEQVGGEMSATKRAAVRHGDMKRDFSLLDYNKRYNFDLGFGMAFPYQFWFTRSMVNWALRFADRPGMLAFFARLSQFTDEEMDDRYKVIPSRLKNKVRIPVPFLNSFAPWTGGNIYVDPWGKLFPFREFLRPWENYLGDQNRVRRKAEQYLADWADSGEITGEEAQEAITAGAGNLWDRAMAEAQANEGGDIVDFMSVMSSPSLAISLLVRGPEKTGPFPMSRMIQGLAAATGADWLTTLDVEANLRKQAKLSEFGEWGDYYVDRQLANLTADGEITAEDAQTAMIERAGPAYEMALDRVRMEIALRQPGMLPILAARNALQGDGNVLDVLGSALVSWLPGGLLPEGELELRGLQAEYSQAWQDFHAGNKNAIDKFFEDHPEYKARLSLYDAPEERLQNFLVSSVWEKYGELPEPLQKAAANQLGDTFREYFLNSETRDYTAIPADMLSQWAQALGGYAPGAETTTEQLQFTGLEAAQQYQQAKDQLFPGIGGVLSQYYGMSQDQQAAFKAAHPEIQAYQNWRDMFVASNPELIPYMVSQDSELAQASPETAYMVYMYRAEKARLFPDISQLLDQYYAQPTSGRKVFAKQNPAIYDYWDWEREILTQSPDIARYVKSDASAFRYMFGENYTEKYGTPTNVYQWPSEMQSQMQNYFTRDIPLTGGAMDYARLQWDKSGRPFGSFTRWLDSLGVFYGGV